MAQSTAAKRAAPFPSLADLQTWAEALDGSQSRLAPNFARAEPRPRALTYLTSLLSATERKNGWQLAELAGETPRWHTASAQFSSAILLLKI